MLGKKAQQMGNGETIAEVYSTVGVHSPNDSLVIQGAAEPGCCQKDSRALGSVHDWFLATYLGRALDIWALALRLRLGNLAWNSASLSPNQVV